MKYICGLSLALLGISPLLIAGDYPGRNIVTPGTRVEVRTDSPVIVAQWDRGRIYPAHVVRDVFSTQGEVMIPRGANCEMIVRELGPGQLALDLESITVAGRRYVMEASGPQFNMNQDQYNRGAGVVGNIIGAIAGAAGADVQYQGDRVHVPAGAELTFQLQQPLHIATWRDEGYQNRGNHYHREENHGWYR